MMHYDDYTEQERKMTPAAERLLLALHRSDKGEGVRVRYLSRGRYHWDGPHGAAFNRASFRPLYAHGLVDDSGSESTPLRLTDAGRERAKELHALDTERRNRPRKKPDAESPAAQRALAALAKFDGPTRPHSGQPRGIWHLGSRDGFAARELTFYALVKAGYAAITRGDFLAVSIAITDAGRERLKRGQS